MQQKIHIEKFLDEFIEKGGTFLRKSFNKGGQPTIEQFNKFTQPRWKVRLTFSTESLRDKNFNHLTRVRKQFFKAKI
jgi:hypothetical protein